MDKEGIQNLMDQALLMDLMGTLVSCGVPILDTLDTLKETFPRYSTAMGELREHIAEGGSIEGYLKKTEHPFHPLVKAMIPIGESTGALDIVLAKLSDYMEMEVQMRSKGLEGRSLQELAFYHSLAISIDAGLPLVQSLKVLEECGEFLPTEVIRDLRDQVDTGKKTLADAMKGHRDYFPPYAVNIVAAGEVGGILDTTLNRLCQYIEKKYKLDHLLE